MSDSLEAARAARRTPRPRTERRAIDALEATPAYGVPRISADRALCALEKALPLGLVKSLMLFVERYGIGGVPQLSVAEAAERYGISREEVRRNEALVLRLFLVALEQVPQRRTPWSP